MSSSTRYFSSELLEESTKTLNQALCKHIDDPSPSSASRRCSVSEKCTLYIEVQKETLVNSQPPNLPASHLMRSKALQVIVNSPVEVAIDYVYLVPSF